MTKLAVVAFPRLAEPDRRWIESVRTLHDPQATLIPVHFTVVFPVESEPSALISRAASASERSPRISFRAEEVLAVRDPGGEGGHVFLLPDVGSSRLVALHRQLTDDAPEDREFVPHMTVAGDVDFGKCAELAQRLSALGRSVEGCVESLDVVALSGDRVKSIARLPFRGTDDVIERPQAPCGRRGRISRDVETTRRESMTKISSSATWISKRGFPALWFGVLGLDLVAGPSFGDPAQDIASRAVSVVMIVFGYFLFRKFAWDLLDEVYDCGDSLLIRNRGEEDRIEISDIMNVSVSTNMRPQRITLRLIRPSTFGSEIAFSPYGEFTLNPLAKNGIAEDLIVRVDRASARRGA